MKRHLGLALAAAAALAVGVALAQPPGPVAAPPQERSALERLNDLEKRVAQLSTQVQALVKEKSKPGAPDEQLDQVQGQLDEIYAYLGAQADSASKLDAALEESREKGFTYGINPDSRKVMLAGFEQFTATLQTEVPTAPEPAKEQAQPKR